MKKALKVILISIVCLCLLVIIGGYIALTQIDFNNYKTMISKSVFDATGRELVVGNIKVKPSFSPVIEISDVTFANETAGHITINEDVQVLEAVMQAYDYEAIKAEFQNYVNVLTKKFVEKFSSRDERKYSQKYLLEIAKKTDLYNQFSEMGIGWLSQIEENKKQNNKDLLSV